MSTEEQNVAVMRAMAQAWNDGTVAQVGASRIAPEFVRHDLAGAWADVTGPDGVADFNRMWNAALADMHLEIVDIFGAGDRVCVHLIGSGIHRGPLLGVPPTGKRVEWHGINIYRLANGKIVETWQLGDVLGILRQIGAVSIVGQAAS